MRSELLLDAGDALFAIGDPGSVWQLERGVMRLDRAGRDGVVGLAQVALPGDWLGLEAIAAYGHQFEARAVVPCLVRRCSLMTDAERRLALMDALLQSQQRAADLVALRTGPAGVRLKSLLALLALTTGDPAHDEERALPTIRDMAVLIDATPETVSRILSQLRRRQVLTGRSRQGARFSLARLQGSTQAAAPI